LLLSGGSCFRGAPRSQGRLPVPARTSFVSHFPRPASARSERTMKQEGQPQPSSGGKSHRLRPDDRDEAG